MPSMSLIGSLVCVEFELIVKLVKVWFRKRFEMFSLSFVGSLFCASCEFDLEVDLCSV